MTRASVRDLRLALPAAVTVAGMVATPLVRRGGPAIRVLSNVVVSGLFSTTTALAARRWGGRRSGAAAVGVALGTLAVERVGSRSGVPFGRYSYSTALQPQVAGVPAVVPLAWFAMALPAREVAHAALGTHTSPLRRVVLGSAALTAWDLFLDPQMVAEGYWRWNAGGRYGGIPFSNFAGWFATGLGVMAALEAVLTSHDEADPLLVGEYAFVGAMETLGFAAFFRDRVVAATGGSAMLPLALVAIRAIRRRR